MEINRLGLSFCGALAMCFVLAPRTFAVNDVTAHIELLGNPALAQYPVGSSKSYARNIWDLQGYNSRLYLGYGDAANNSSAKYIWYFDPAGGSFTNDYSTARSEQQIGILGVIGQDLVVPGYDPASNPAAVYRLRQGVWTSHSVPRTIHAYNAAQRGSQFLCVVGAETNYADVRISNDDMQTWQAPQFIDEAGHALTPYSGRMYTLFELNGALYASGYDVYLRSTGYLATRLMRYEGNNVMRAFTDATALALFPGFSISTGEPRVVRPVLYGSQTVYIGGIKNNDHQWLPFGLYRASSLTQVTAISLPNPATPRDIVVSGGICYVLGSIPQSSTSFTVTVHASADLVHWTEVLRFTSDAFARSFEMLNGDLYFGLGAETDYVPDSTGNILRVKKQYFSGLSNLTPAAPKGLRRRP